jgi:hypothetical protein
MPAIKISRAKAVRNLKQAFRIIAKPLSLKHRSTQAPLLRLSADSFHPLRQRGSWRSGRKQKA